MSQEFYDYDVSKSRIKDDTKTFSRLFLCLTFSLIIPYLFLMLVSFVLSFFQGLPQSLFLIINDSYTLFVAILFSLFSKSVISRRPIALSDMTKGKFFLFVCASVPLMIAGALTGNIFSSVLGSVLNRDITNVVATLTNDYPFALIFVSVIIVAPVFEELMFRKLLIDKISRFGFSFSVLISGVVFGTFHGNFYQLFYGCLLGFLLAFVYCMYSKIRYCIMLHSLINFIGFVCPIYLGKFLSSSNPILNFVAVCYSLLYYICIPFGIIVIILGIKTINIKNPSLFCTSGTSLVFKNTGFVLYLIFALTMLTLSVLL